MNSLNQKNILLIEDDTEIRDLYKRILSQKNFNVIAVESSEDADKLLVNLIPDLVLLDIMLPGENGMMFLKRLKQADELRKVPVILLTNIGETDVINQAFNFGAQGYILKAHLTPQNLINEVEKFMENPDLKLDLDKLG